MALLCVPVSKLVSFAFSTIPIIMYLLIQRMFSFTCLHKMKCPNDPLLIGNKLMQSE